jgi:cytochrome c oxidase subunit 1
VLHVGIFSPQLGGDPLLFQHMFWFYSHPADYIMILPSMGVISEVVPVFSR